MTTMQKLTELTKQKEEILNLLRDNEISAVNERKIKDWMAQCIQDLEIKEMNLSGNDNMRYW